MELQGKEGEDGYGTYFKNESSFKEMIWGGTKLKDIYGYEIPSDHTGECWAISAHKNGDCTIADGEYKGKTLSWLFENHRELFGNIEGDQFPLLVKIIDAKMTCPYRCIQTMRMRKNMRIL